jgi:formylglycine-generating enzyme required for sulfatase activity
MTALGTAATRGPRLPVWRSLPRGLVLERRYRVEAEVGRGGMASVYRAIGVDRVNKDRPFALKVPAPELLAEAATCDRFVTEIQVAQKLSGKHPAIIETFTHAIFDDPHSGRELYGLVMEYIDGPTLAHYLAERQAKNKPLEPREILHVLKPVCEALEDAHSQGVYHRDVKPQNVLLTRKSQAKLADFGIARVLEDARATVTGQADMGTLAYMAPDRDFDARSDVYLLGNLLLELLTFDPRGDVEARADCPPGWVELVADSMNRLKGKRPQTVREFLGRLEDRTDKPSPASSKKVEAPPPVPKEIVIKSLGMKLAFLPHGTFWMGDRGSQRPVEILHDFYIGVFPVTQHQWQDLMGSNPSYFSRNGGGAANVKGIPDDHLKQFPVEQVSWHDVQEFLGRLNAREKSSGFLYRLPTEAEWEYSCRGGASSQQDCAFHYYLAQPTNELTSGQANFGGSLGRTTKVGSYKPNRLGIYDMHGNVWEWCEDVYQGSSRVFRGGGWSSDAADCRASYRDGYEPSDRGNCALGFRLAAVPSGE